MYGHEGNSYFCFPKSPDVSWDEGTRATTAQLYPGRDTLILDQGHVTKIQPITMLALLLGI